MIAAFLASLGSEVSYVRYPKSIEEPTTKSWPQAGRQNSEGFGGGYRVS
jgi:hypothetical protein